MNNDNSLTAGHSSSSSVNLSLRNNFQTHTLRGEGLVREDSLQLGWKTFKKESGYKIGEWL